MAFELLQFLKSYIYKPYIPPFFLSPSCTKYRQKHTGGTRRKNCRPPENRIGKFPNRQTPGNSKAHPRAGYLKIGNGKNTRRLSCRTTPCRPSSRHAPLPIPAGCRNGSSRAGLPEAGLAAYLPQTLPASLPALPPDNCQAARHQPPTLGLPCLPSTCKLA